jgi:hypothetical protein
MVLMRPSITCCTAFRIPTLSLYFQALAQVGFSFAKEMMLWKNVGTLRISPLLRASARSNSMLVCNWSVAGDKSFTDPPAMLALQMITAGSPV